jgi:radical SAM superfamily enzyme YgiQ (UPF0313 family)
MKRNVYLAQPNHSYGSNCFLPYSAGLLQAYAQKHKDLRETYDFQPIIFRREDISQILARMQDKPPDVLGLSCYIWNFEYNMALARAVKERFPLCLIVAGGPHIPIRSEDFAQPAVDVAVHYEGEKAFSGILLARLADPPGPAAATASRIENLDDLPSPYLSGIFDGLIADNPALEFHATQETHRGCPYQCIFCDWGSAVFTKLRKFEDNRIFLELGWMVEHKIELLYNADANYGIFPRDLGITKVMAGAKREHGYPKKFRAAFAKNSNDKIFEHARILHEAGMNKGVTLSFQSMDEKVLETVKRDNIKITDFKRLMGKYQAAGIATYSEVILGLPGETYDSFAQGLNTLLDCGQHDSLQIYTCEVLPNSEMNAPAYKKEHEIRSVRSPIPMFHGTPAVDPCQEYYDLVVSTKTMPTEHWLHAQMLAWIVQAFHCLGLTQQIAIAMNRLHDLSYRRFYEAILDQVDRADQGSVIATVIQAAARSFEDLLSGKDWGAYNPSFGNVTWPPEEASFLQIVSIRKQFYEELFPIVKRLCPGAADILEDLFLYQAELVATPDGEPRQVRLAHDWPEFFRGGTYKDVPCTLKIEPEGLYQGNLENFAREVIWYGRKGGTFKNKVSYADR